MLKLPENIQALIFDCDGTLVDNMLLHLLSWQQAFELYGESFTAEILAKTSGIPLIETIEYYNSTFGANLDPALVAAHKDIFFEKMLHHVVPVEDLCQLAFDYKDILPMSVVSGSNRESVDTSLIQAGVKELFSIVLTSDDPFKGKPAPDLFLEAARLMGVDPEYCVVFEDGEAGMIGARAAGMHVLDVQPVVDKQRLNKN